MLIEEGTGFALEVRGASIDPDTPILALPKSGNTNQKWKYSTVMSSVSISLDLRKHSELNRLDKVKRRLNWSNKKSFGKTKCKNHNVLFLALTAQQARQETTLASCSQ